MGQLANAFMQGIGQGRRGVEAAHHTVLNMQQNAMRHQALQMELRDEARKKGARDAARLYHMQRIARMTGMIPEGEREVPALDPRTLNMLDADSLEHYADSLQEETAKLRRLDSIEEWGRNKGLSDREIAEAQAGVRAGMTPNGVARSLSKDEDDSDYHLRRSKLRLEIVENELKTLIDLAGVVANPITGELPQDLNDALIEAQGKRKAIARDIEKSLSLAEQRAEEAEVQRQATLGNVPGQQPEESGLEPMSIVTPEQASDIPMNQLPDLGQIGVVDAAGQLRGVKPPKTIEESVQSVLEVMGITDESELNEQQMEHMAALAVQLLQQAEGMSNGG